MTRQQKLLAYLVTDIGSDQQDYRHLESQLEALFPHLVERNSQQVATLNQIIEGLLSAISERTVRRTSILQALGVTAPAQLPAAGDMHAALALLPTAERTSAIKQWQQLQQQVAHTRTLNERNGDLLALQQEVVQTLLEQRESSGIYRQSCY